ncbi:MAG: hypothetical protein HYY18_17315 [Planctomycetes bacterium]|nr:hypothetical protein [Planctomycetota bacterium]
MNRPNWNQEDEQHAESGRIWLDQGFVCYDSKVYPSFRIRTELIRAIGEYTNQSGPVSDDYFLVLLTPHGSFEASFYACGRDEFMRELREIFPGLLDFGLCNSADFQSRVLWPPELSGHELYRFQPKKPVGLVERLTGVFLPRVDLILADEVLALTKTSPTD